MKALPKLLVCDDDPIFQIGTKTALTGLFECFPAADCDAAITLLKKHTIHILLLDVHLRQPNEGLAYIPQFLELDSDLSIVMSSQDRNFNTVREALRLGAVDFVPKQFEPNELVHSLNRILERRELLRAQQQKDFETRTLNKQFRLIGQGSWLDSLQRTIEKVRQTSANVVIFGETGTGKEVVARQLRRTLKNGSLEPFVTVDSSTILSSTAESALFGHEKGAFTGADRASKGVFEEANGGTIYFDEISNMPLNIQAKLLRVLQEREICRVGSTKTIPLDFRVICASNRDLRKMVAAGEFKADLFQRLHVVPIALHPLRDRKQDIVLLLNHFVKKFPSNCGTLSFSPQTLESLHSYSWPGNIRELENLVFYLSTMAEQPEVDPTHLPLHITVEVENTTSPEISSPTQEPHSEPDDFYCAIQDFEKKFLRRRFEKFKGRVTPMAKALKMDRSHLYSKLKQFEIYQKMN